MNPDNIISFIIPHKGRFNMLKQTLRSIAAQDYPLDKIEVIVVSQIPENKHLRGKRSCYHSGFSFFESEVAYAS